MQTTNPEGTSQKDSYTAGLLTDSQQLTTGTTPTAISDTSFYYNPNRTLQYSTDYTGTTNYKEFQDGTPQAVQLPGEQWQTATSIDQGTEDPTNVTNPDNTTTKQTENEMGQTATQSGAGVIASKLGYNADGQMTTLTTYSGGDPTNPDDPGVATTWGFDPATGLMTGKSYKDGNGIDYKYNPAGQLKTVTEPGMSGSFGYNAAGQQTSSTAIDSQTGMVLSQVLAEDDQGRAMLTMSLDNGQFASDTNTYTALGQPLNESFGAAGNATVAHGYYPLTPGQHDPSPTTESPDALASMTIQNLPSGQANASTTYGYDPTSKRLQTITVNGVTFTIGYVNGSMGQIGSITTTVAGQTGNELTTTFGPYGSNASLLGTITATSGSGSQLYWASLGYNANQQINSDLVIRSNVDGTQSTDNYGYSYGTGPGDNSNDANSLTQVKDNGNVTESYSFDGVGNFENTSLGDANTLNQYAALSYNLRGDVTNDATYAYTYDANDRMISVTPDNPSSGDKLTFGYDSQGRRTWKNVYTWDHYNSVWDLAYSRSYVYDGTQLVGELDGNGKLLTGYTWSPGGALLAVTDYTQTTPKTYQAILDASGNTALLVDLTNGTVAASYTYDSYGNLLTATGPAQAICSILGKGLYYDLEARSIGHALNRDIRLNTWYERDPAGEIAGGPNLYQPYGGDPIDLSDTSGNAPTRVQQQAINTLSAQYGPSWSFRATPTGYIGIHAAAGEQMDFDLQLNQIAYSSPDHSWQLTALPDGSLWKTERSAPHWWSEWQTTSTQLLPSTIEAQKAVHQALEDCRNPSFAMADQMAATNAQNQAKLIGIRDGILAAAKFGLEALGAANPLVGISEIKTGRTMDGKDDMQAGDYAAAGMSIVPGEVIAIVGGKLIKMVVARKSLRFFNYFDALKAALGPAGEGMAWHHIVEQSQEARFGPEAIHNTANVIAISRDANSALNALYSSKRFDITGSTTLTVREWLSTKSYAEARAFGIKAMRKVLSGTWP